MKNIEDIMEQELRRIFKERLQEEMQDLLHDFIADLAKACVAEEWGKIVDIPLAPKQVAQIMGVNLSTLYEWHRKGKLRFTKNGKHMFIRLGDVYTHIMKSKCNS